MYIIRVVEGVLDSAERDCHTRLVPKGTVLFGTFLSYFLLAWFLTETLRLVRFLGSVSGSQLILLYICG